MLKKTFKPRFCILNKNNELEAYRDPNVRRSIRCARPSRFGAQDQATGTKHALLSDLHVCDVVDIKDDKNDGFLFSLRINKTLHELCADTEQVRSPLSLERLSPRQIAQSLLPLGALSLRSHHAHRQLGANELDCGDPKAPARPLPPRPPRRRHSRLLRCIRAGQSGYALWHVSVFKNKISVAARRRRCA